MLHFASEFREGLDRNKRTNLRGNTFTLLLEGRSNAAAEAQTLVG